MTGLDAKIARLRAGIKQYRLAAILGIPQTRLCQLEASDTLPDEWANRILTALDGEVVYAR